MADAHPADGETGERADEERQEHRRHADIKAVAELVPEIREIPIALGQDDAEALERRLRRPDVVGEDVAMRLERDQDDVVDRRQRPDQQDHGKAQRRRLAQVSPQPVAPAPPHRQGLQQRRAHSCTSVVRSFRISRMTSGIISGSADITVATPRSGRATSKALRMPSVASTCVDKAGPPPETK